MGLSIKEKVALQLSALEYHLPSYASKALLPAVKLRVADPFRAREHELNAIFCHVPKTAGTSIATTLFDEKARHVPLSRYYLFDPEKTERYFKFTVVRNPWSRLLSAYNYLHARVGTSDFRDHRWATQYLQNTPDFEAFINKLHNSRYRNRVMNYVHFRNQLDWISVGTGRSKRTLVDTICRFENLQEDFQPVAARLGVEPALPVLRKGNGGNYREHYSPAMQSFVHDLYAQDIEAFNYQFQ